MAKCPTCKKEVSKPQKNWKYGQFAVQAYSCNNCGTQFREYTKEGKYSFTLKRAEKRRGGYVKT